MVIGIDCSPLNRARKTGTEYYLDNLVWAMIQADKKNEYWLYSRLPLGGRYRKLPDNVKNKVLLWFPYLWTQGRLALEMLFRKPDVLFVPAHTIPWIHPAKTIMTVHDIAYEYYPRSYTGFQLWHLRYTTRKALRWAAKIIAVSENTRKDLIKFYKAEKGKVVVVRHGVDHRFTRKINSQQVADIKKKYLGGLSEDFILFVGRIERRKNLPIIIKAFRQLLVEYRLPVRLVLAGKMGYGAEELQKQIKQLRLEQKVYFPGYVSDDDLPNLLAAAKIFAYPSSYEGFGLPLLEAMGAGVPVVASDIPVLYEVAGPAALLVKPDDLAGWTQALLKVWSSNKIRKQMIINGKDRVKDFSWVKTAKETLAVIRDLKKS